MLRHLLWCKHSIVKTHITNSHVPFKACMFARSNFNILWAWNDSSTHKSTPLVNKLSVILSTGSSERKKRRKNKTKPNANSVLLNITLKPNHLQNILPGRTVSLLETEKSKAENYTLPSDCFAKWIEKSTASTKYTEHNEVLGGREHL